MICSPCGQGRHDGCRWPTSCPCHHRDPEVIAHVIEVMGELGIPVAEPVRGEADVDVLLAPQTGPVVLCPGVVAPRPARKPGDGWRFAETPFVTIP